MRAARTTIAAVLPCAMGATVAMVNAQDLEPRRWTPLPVDTSIVGAGLVHTDGTIYSDPVLRITDGKFESRTFVLSFLHAFGLLGRAARVDVRLPHREVRWRGLLDGESRSVGRTGPGDPRLRLSVNLLGGPAMDRTALRAYTGSHPVSTVVGAAMAITLPLGEYFKDKLLNIGENRFVIGPELGVVHTRGPWSFELTGSAYLFTDNDAFRGHHRRAQDPLHVLQIHLVRNFAAGWWGSLSGEYVDGGGSSLDGTGKNDRRGDLFHGISLGLPLNRQSSAKIAYVVSRTREAIGADTKSLAISYSFRF